MYSQQQKARSEEITIKITIETTNFSPNLFAVHASHGLQVDWVSIESEPVVFTSTRLLLLERSKSPLLLRRLAPPSPPKMSNGGEKLIQSIDSENALVPLEPSPPPDLPTTAMNCTCVQGLGFRTTVHTYLFESPYLGMVSIAGASSHVPVSVSRCGVCLGFKV
jgi:hypothetical protein